MNPQELQRAEELKAKYKIGGSSQATPEQFTMTAEDVIRRRALTGQGGSMLSNLKRDIGSIGTAITESIDRRGQTLTDISEAQKEGKQGFLRSTLQKIGQGAGFASDVIGSTLFGGVKAVTPEAIQKPVGEIVEAGVEKVMDTTFAQNIVDWYQNLDEKTQRDIGATSGIVQLALDVVGGSAIKQGAKPVAQAVSKTAQETAEQVARGVSATTKAVGEVVSPVVSPFAQIPKNIKTNIQTGIATDKAIRQLPTKPLQNAVRSGVDIQDVQTLTKLDAPTKQISKKLVQTVKDFADGNTTRNPIELVGKPIVKRLQTLTTDVKSIGSKLDKTAKSLQFKSVQGTDDLLNKADDSLRNLEVNLLKQKGGKLDFKGSQLEGLGSNSEIVNNVYKRLINSKDAYDLHRLKKYIDDNVTFGKTSQGMTGTAENVLKSWRKSIDDILDKQFDTYKQLNDEYAKRIQPLNAMKQFLKSNTGLDEDLLSLKAGGLMRRLTSNAQSKAELKQILRNLDKATNRKGRLATNTEQLVELYSILEKYYPEIIGKNTFRGQSSAAITDVKGFSEMAIGAAKKLGGQTDAVKRKAFEEALKDIFGI